MNVSNITDQNNVLYRQMTVNNLEKRHEVLRIEEMRVREALKNNEMQGAPSTVFLSINLKILF